VRSADDADPPAGGGIVTRFAPAPTGYLHLGHVVNAIYVWGVARGRLQAPGLSAARALDDGVVLLRIEDHDRQRSRYQFEAAIVEDLAWLGFVPDRPLIRQSERGALYQGLLEGLQARGLVYACDCSRSDIGGGRYPGTCRDKGLKDSPGRSLRVRLEPSSERFVDLRHGALEQQPSEQCGDLVVRDRAGNWTYHFAAVADDIAQGVTLVVRGDDLLDSTGRQIQLARLLGRTPPPSFLHHPLVMKTATQKLSKSDGHTGIRELRAKGWSAAQVIEEAVRRSNANAGPGTGWPRLELR
jgi:glutamyl-tRNA synthetase/glutamyl-Q tRNA(Asp) synthetase